jgi:GDPmannose 4,6-dehydratase
MVLGSSGQTGSYLVQKLLSDGNEVIGIARKKFPYRIPNQDLFTEITLDPSDIVILERIVETNKFDVVVNFLSLSSVAECASNPDISQKLNLEFACRLFDLVSKKSFNKNLPIRILQASSSEMYGGYSSDTLIDETVPLNPISVYGKHKSIAHQYLEQIKADNPLISGSSLILFNHESPRRDARFVTKKIIDRIFEISAGRESELHLGDIEVRRDWGYAAEFAEGISKIVGYNSNANFVIATGSLHSVREFCDEAFQSFDIPRGKRKIVCDESLKRSSNNNGLAGNSDFLSKELNWRPRVGFQELVKILVASKLGGK